MNPILLEILNQTLRCEYVQADVTPLPSSHSTGWRTMPFFMYSQAGAGSERVQLADGRVVVAGTGEVIVLPAGVAHRVDVLSRREVRQWAHVNYFILGNVDLFTLLETPVLLDRSVGEPIGHAIAEWVRTRSDHASDPLLKVAREHEFATHLLGLLAPFCKPRADAQEVMTGLKRLNPAMQYMQQHPELPIRRNDLARMVGLSPAQFHVVFNQVLQATPMDYLRTVRLRHAQQLLILTRHKVKEIAARCGYDDPFVFCKFFKRSCKMSPSQYRRQTQLLPSQ